MSKIFSLEIVKKRPVLTAAVVLVGGLVVYLMFFRGSQSEPERQGYGDANVNAASNLATNQAMQARGQEIQGQLAAIQLQGQNELAVTMAQANLQRDLAALSLESARLDHARDLYGIQVQENIEKLGIQTSAQIQQLQIQSQLQAMEAQTNRDVAIQQLMIQGNVSLAQQAAQVQIAGINAQTELAKINSNTQIQTAQINAGAQKSIAKSGASASKTGTYGAIALGVLSLFCDRYIKTIDGCVNEDACANAIRNMPVEMWRYLDGSVADDGGRYHINTYSQDFYRELGAPDWQSRNRIEIVDYLGALSGAFKSLDRKVTQ